LIKLATLAALSCSTPARDESAGSKPAENQVLFEDVRIDRWEQDRLRYRAYLGSVRLDRESGHVLGESVRADVLDREARIETRVTAPRLVSDLRSRLVRLEQGVVVRDEAGRTLRTETLQYDSGADQLETSAPVEIEGDNFRANGGRLSGQPRAGQLEIEGPTTGTITPSSPSAR
jgi:LPS export ABC transporter protein LptC